MSPGETGSGFEGARPGSDTGVDQKLNDFPLTQAGNAEAFAHLQHGRVLYDHRRRNWLLRGEHHWRVDDVGAVVQLAKAVIRERQRAALEVSGEGQRQRAVKFALASESRQQLESLLELARSEPTIADRGESWDAEPMLLGVENGVVDLTTGVLRDGRPDDRISLVSPISFLPNALCPRWEQFLQEVFLGRNDLIGFVHRAIGYSLTGDTSEHALFLLHGSGRNGKSVLLNTIRAVAGTCGINLPFSAFELMGRSQLTPELALLPGKRLATSSETNDGTRLNEARIKAMTGGDSVTANPKYQAPFEFTPVAKYWLAVNHLPVVRDDSDGFWQRVRVIRFERRFTEEERDKRLEERLRDELPGILAWAVRGTLEWQQRGLEAPEYVRVATEEYRVDSDPLEEFLTSRCAIGDDLEAAAGDLYTAYLGYADEVGLERTERLSNTMFGRRIGKRFPGTKTRQGKRYQGLDLLNRGSGDGSRLGDEFEGRPQENHLEDLLYEEFPQNRSQPITQPRPTTDRRCNHSRNSLNEQGALCFTCLGNAPEGSR